MNPNKQTAAVPSTETATQPTQIVQPTPSIAPPSIEEKSTQYRSPRVDMSSIYPDASRNIGSTGGYTTSQQTAVLLTESQSAESNKPVSLRAKSVLIVGVIMALSTISVIFALLTDESVKNNSVFQTIIGVLAATQALMTVYLLFSNDSSAVLLVLRILIIIQLLGLFMSLLIRLPSYLLAPDYYFCS